MAQEPELPELPFFGIDDNFFFNGGAATPAGAGLPPLHPRGSRAGTLNPPRETIEITDEELAQHLQRRESMPMMVDPKILRDWKVKFGVFDIGIDEQKEALEEIQSMTLRQEAMLLREEWNSTPMGATIISIKWMEKNPTAPQKKKDDEDAGTV